MRHLLLALALGVGLSASAVASNQAPARTDADTSSGWPSSYAASVDPGVAAFSPDGALVVVDDNGTTGIWRTTGWRRVRPLDDLDGHARFSPDGKKIVTFGPGAADPQILDAASGRSLHRLRGHTGGRGIQDHSGWTTGAVFSPDGRRVLTAGWDGTARIWDVATGRSLRVLRGHTDVVETAVFSPDGTLIATAGLDERARVWDAKTGRCLHVLHGGEAAFFSPDGGRLLTSTGTTTAIWDPSSGRRLRLLHGGASAMSPNGRLIALSLNGQTRLVDARSGRRVGALGGEALGFSADGTLVATTGSDRKDGPHVQVWDPAGSRLLRTFRGHSDGEVVETGIFSPNGSLLLTEVNRIGETRIWSLATGRLVKSFG